VIFCFAVIQEGESYAQNSGGIRVRFLKGDIEMPVNDFAVNVLQLINTTEKSQTIKLFLSLPAGWEIMGNLKDDYLIDSNDSLYIPVRLMPRGSVQGGMTYTANAFISLNNLTIASAVWNISVRKESNWNVNLSSNKVYFTNESDSCSFELRINNTGNSEEELQVHAVTEKGIYFKGSRGELLTEVRKNVKLKIKQDTFLLFRVVKDDILPKPYEYQSSEQINRLRINVKSQNPVTATKGDWSGRVSFISLDDKRKVEDSFLPSFPLTFEWDSYNVLNRNTYGSLNLYGSKVFSNSASMTYYYQSNFVQNEIDWNSYLGNYFYLGYFSSLYNVELGDISAGRSGSLLVGKGAKGSVKYKEHQLGGLYIQKPTILDEVSFMGYGAFYNYSKAKLNGSVYAESSNDDLWGIKTDFATANVGYKINNYHAVNVGGGYSMENFANQAVESTSGYKGMFSYQGTVKQINIHLNALHHSPSYAPRRGINQGSAIASYPLNSTMRIRGGVSGYESRPTIVRFDGLIIDSIFNGRKNAFAQLLLTQGDQSYVFQPEYIIYESNLLTSNTAGLGVEFRSRKNKDLSVYTTAFVGQDAYPTHRDVNPIFLANARLSLRYKGLNANVRYYYGPNYLNEKYVYLNTLENPQRLFGMLYYDYWFAKNSMRFNTNMNYNYTTIQGRQQMVIRPELFYYSNNRFEFSVYGSYIMYANAEYEREPTEISGVPISKISTLVPAQSMGRMEFGFGVKFNINVPAGITRNYKTQIIVFRDANGNGVQDSNEEGYGDMLIRLSRTDESFVEDDQMMNPSVIYELITNEKGVAEYRHVPKGNYKIESMPLISSSGWYGNRELYRMIDGNQVIYLPLSKGARLSGGVIVERDVHSDNKVLALGAIRVTAMNQLTGEMNSTLTDEFGNYSMHLPNGDYVVSINEGAVGSRFQFLENNIPVSVKSSGESLSVGFLLVEKGRKINFGRNGANSRLMSSGVKDNRFASEEVDPSLVPVSKDVNSSKMYAVSLFASEQGRLKKADFDSLQAVTSVYCVQGEGGNYLYYTNSFTSKKPAKKLLSKVIAYGYDDASMVELKPPAKEKMMKEEKANEKKSSDELVRSTGESNTSVSKSLQKIENDEDKALYRIQFDSSALLFEAGDFKETLPDVDVIYFYTKGDVNYYSVGAFSSEKQAKKYLKEFKTKYQTAEAVVKQYKDEE